MITVTCNVNRVAALRAGINTGCAVAQIPVDPAALSQENRNLLASHCNADLEVCHREERTGLYHYGGGYTASDPHIYYDRNRWPENRPSMVTASAPTIEAVLDAIRANEAAVAACAAQRAQKELAEQQERRANTLAVLTERKTKTTTRWIGAKRRADGTAELSEPSSGGVSVGSYAWTVSAQTPEYHYADWPLYGDKQIIGSPESQAWLTELEAKKQAAIRAAEAEAIRRLEAEEQRKARAAEADRQAEVGRNAWIAEHGSTRLKRLLAEGIELENTYLDERIALERPGWAYQYDRRGEANEARNARQTGLDLLDEARKTAPQAKLVWWTVEHEHDDCGEYDECPKYDWKGYACTSTFLGIETVFGVPTDYTT